MILSFYISARAEKVSEGRPLRNYDKVPQNNKLKTNIERVSKLGQPLAMKCSSEIPIESCQWQSPEGQSFSMRDLPQGYKSIIDNEKTCHIMIEKLETAQLGKWSCIVRQKGQKQYQQAYMTATEVVPVTDVRLPTHADPESYVIHLTPFIIEGNYSIEGNLTLVDVEILRYSTKFPSKSFFFTPYFCKLFRFQNFTS